MEKNVRKFLRNSFVSVIGVCVVVFIGLVLVMGKRTEDTIDEISEIYMSEMNTQLGQKFTSIIGLRLEQVQGLIRQTPPNFDEYNEAFISELTSGGEVREFSFLGLYAEDGELETLYGGQITISQESIIQSLKKDGNIVTMGMNDKEERMLILGRGAEYPMKNGGKSMALIAGVPMDYLKEVLFLDSNDTLVYTHIIDSDGNFVIRSGDAFRESYFERIMSEAKDHKGSAEEYVSELREAMKNGEDYSKLVTINGEKRYTYCTPIEETHDWYLITVMNNEAMDAPISALDLQRIGIMIGSSLDRKSVV